MRARKHKGSVTGPAKIILSDEQEALVELYMDTVRSKIVPNEGCSKLAFLSFTGGQVRQVSRMIGRIWAREGYPGQFSLTAVRKVVETESFNRLGPLEQQQVSTALAHTASVAKKHYTAVTTEKAAKCQLSIAALIHWAWALR